MSITQSLLFMESPRLSPIYRPSLLVSLSVLAFVSACGSDKTSDSGTDTSSDSTSSSSGSSSHTSSSHTSSVASTATTSQTSGHTSSATTQESDETSDDTDTSDESTTGSSSQTTGNGSSTAVSTSGSQDSETDESDSATTESDSSTTDNSSTTTELSAYERLCSTCHGPTGDGVEGLGSDVKHPVEDYSEWVIRNGRTGTSMVAFDTEALSDDELAEIMEFLANQEQPTTGEGLYLDYCAACHGDDGLGGPTMRPIVNEVQEAEEIVRNGHGGSTFSDRREYMPKWSDAEISGAELDLIITYIESL